MTDYDDVYEDDEDFDAQPQAPQGDHLVKNLRKQLAEKSKAEKTLAAELEALRQRDRERSISEVLSASGVSPKVAKLIPANVEPTEEAVKNWLEEYGDVLGAKPASAPSEPDPEVVGQITAMNAVAASGSVPGGPSNVTVDDLKSADSIEALRALIARAKGA